MIQGEVNDKREAIVEISVRGSSEIALDVIVDTGFADHLTLPAQIIASLGLKYYANESARLGDGSIVEARLYRASALLSDSWTPITVHESEGDVLAGMLLFDSMSICIDAAPGGQVTIQPLD